MNFKAMNIQEIFPIAHTVSSITISSHTAQQLESGRCLAPFIPQSCTKMSRIKILFLCAILTNFLQLYKAIPQQSDLFTLDGFIRQIRQLERTPTNANDFVKQAEMALHSTGKILTVIDWAYETNITDSNRKQKLGFKVTAYYFFSIFYLCKCVLQIICQKSISKIVLTFRGLILYERTF